MWDPTVHDYLCVFTKGSKDGEDRDERILNAVVVLDISGSMGGPLNAKGEGHRLELAKEAILMFISKLRPSDSFGLVTFNNQGHTVIPVQKVSTLKMEEVTKAVRDIKINGGTTLFSGFERAFGEMKELLSQEAVKPEMLENRIIMLTDVEDNEISNAHKFIS